jgi:hypothetical protein
MSLEQLLDGYSKAGYDFISISDHLKVTAVDHPSLCVIPGMEWNSRAGLTPKTALTRYDHVGIYALDLKIIEGSLRSRELEDLLSQPSEKIMRVLNHPDWLVDEHYDLKKLIRLNGKYDGIEIYNYAIEWGSGQADSTWKWDYLLSMGCPMLGFACDDSHSLNEIGFAWIITRAREKTQQHIFDSIRSGNFYCSTGVTIAKLERLDSTLSIKIEDEAEAQIRIIGARGRLLKETIGSAMEWDFSEKDTSYARFHVRNSAWQQAWSQPFFREFKMA